MITHDPQYRLIHQLNGQLLDLLFFEDDDFLFGDLCKNRKDWIINIIYARNLHSNSLYTSSVLHRSELCSIPTFASNAEEINSTVSSSIGNSGDRETSAVHALDREVPLHASVTGRAMLTQSSIWLTDGMLVGRNAENERYRPFVHVGVDSAFFPRAEVVFPIALRCGFSMSCIGALNLEYFPLHPSAPEISISQRDRVDESMQRVLDVHALFLKIALELSTSERGQEQRLPATLSALEYHKHAILTERTRRIHEIKGYVRR